MGHLPLGRNCSSAISASRIPSPFGILVYRLVTSSVTRRHPPIKKVFESHGSMESRCWAESEVVGGGTVLLI